MINCPGNVANAMRSMVPLPAEVQGRYVGPIEDIRIGSSSPSRAGGTASRSEIRNPQLRLPGAGHLDAGGRGECGNDTQIFEHNKSHSP
jgi:hypothetical protein